MFSLISLPRVGRICGGLVGLTFVVAIAVAQDAPAPTSTAAPVAVPVPAASVDGTSPTQTGADQKPPVKKNPDTTPKPDVPKKADVATLDEVVVSATRTADDPKKLGFSFSQYTEEDLKRDQYHDIHDAVSGGPGVYSAEGGPNGGYQGISIRGNNTDHTLIMEDGMRANSPMFQGAAPFLAFSNLNNLSDIEVVRGPQSTLWGSEAIGGTVAMETKQGSGDPKGSISTEIGSFDTFREVAMSDGTIGNTSYSLHYGRLDTQNERQNNDVRSNDYSFRVDQKLNEDLSIWVTGRGENGFRGEPSSIRPSDYINNDPTSYVKVEHNVYTLHLDDQTTDIWQQRVTIGAMQERYDYIQPENPTYDSLGDVLTPNTDYIAKSQDYSFDWQNNVQVLDNMLVTAGATVDHDTGHDNTFELQDVTNEALYLQDKWELVKNFTLVGGLRYQYFQTAGNALTYRFAGSYLIEESDTAQTKLRSSYGTAFKAPGFLTLYSMNPSYLGNASLHPERSEGWDAGVDQYLFKDKLILSTGYFENSIHDLIALITTDPVNDIGHYQNLNESHNYGIESSVTAIPLDHWKIKATHTWTETQVANPYVPGDFIRQYNVPRHVIDLDTSYEFFDRWTLGSGCQWAIDRQAQDFGSGSTVPYQHRIEDYTLVRFYTDLKVNDHVSLFGRVENALNQKYDETLGFPALSLGVYGGAEVRF